MLRTFFHHTYSYKSSIISAFIFFGNSFLYIKSSYHASLLYAWNSSSILSGSSFNHPFIIKCHKSSSDISFSTFTWFPWYFFYLLFIHNSSCSMSCSIFQCSMSYSVSPCSKSCCVSPCSMSHLTMLNVTLY